MSLTAALASAVSLLTHIGSRVAASADNVANATTPGYKAREVRATTVAGGGSAGGGVRGVVRQSVSVQGLLQASSAPTDLAIAGNGLFPVRGGPTPQDTVRFTRAGGFAVNKEGVLANDAGFELLAYPTNAAGQVTSQTLQPVNPGRVGGTAQATTNLTVAANLPAGAALGDQFTVGAQFRDSLGNELEATLTFQKTGTNRYTLTIGDPALAGTGAAVGSAGEGAPGGPAYSVDVVFNGDGSLQGVDANQDGIVDAATPPDLSVAGLLTGASDLSVALNLGNAGGVDGLTQFDGPFTLGAVSADGAAFGTVSGVAVGPDGTVTALFDNGERRPIYRVPVATFTNPDGLREVTGNAFEATDASGAPLFGTAGTGGAGTVQAGALEQSNVDLATELTRQIEARAVYGAGLATVRTADEMLKDLLDIKA